MIILANGYRFWIKPIISILSALFTVVSIHVSVLNKNAFDQDTSRSSSPVPIACKGELPIENCIDKWVWKQEVRQRVINKFKAHQHKAFNNSSTQRKTPLPIGGLSVFLFLDCTNTRPLPLYVFCYRYFYL